MLYPMHVEVLVKELETDACAPGYFSDQGKRSLVHNSPASMYYERRIQRYNAIHRYWQPLVGKNKDDFAELIDPGFSIGTVTNPVQWTSEFQITATVLTGRWKYRSKGTKGDYKNTYMDLMEFSRCVFEHGPNANVNLKQCEAALYLLSKELLLHFQRTMLTVYTEIPIAPLLPTNPSTVPHIRQVPNLHLLVPEPRRLAKIYVPTVPRKNQYDLKKIFSKT